MPPQGRTARAREELAAVLADEVRLGRVIRTADGRFALVAGKFTPATLAALRRLSGPQSCEQVRAGEAASRGRRVSELRLSVPDDLVEAIARRAAEFVLDELASPQWMTLDEAAKRYRTTAGALRWRAQHDRLPGAVKDGGRWLLNAREYDAALADARTTADNEKDNRKWGERRNERPRPRHRRQ